MIRIKTSKDKKIFAFYREKDENRVVVLLNLSKKPVTFKPVLQALRVKYTEYFTDKKVELPKV